MIDDYEAVRRSDGMERPSRLMDLANNRGGTDRDLERLGALLGKVALPSGLTAVQLLRVRKRIEQSVGRSFRAGLPPSLKRPTHL